MPQEGVVGFIRTQHGGAFGRVSVLDATESAERQANAIPVLVIIRSPGSAARTAVCGRKKSVSENESPNQRTASR